VYTLDDSTGLLADTGEDISAYNLAGSAVEADKMVVCSAILGKWWVTVEDCSS
jgi:hypothetical protein